MDVNEISERFRNAGITVNPDRIQKVLENYKRFGVPENEVERAALRALAAENGIDITSLYTRTVKIEELKSEDEWVTLKAKVVQLWDNEHESVSQVGLIGDETGIVKLTVWKNAQIPLLLEEGKSYLFKNVVTNRYLDRIQLAATPNTEIEEIKEEIQAKRREVTLSGAIVDIINGSGLIKRCPECNRALVKGACGEHGKVDGIYDIRLKAVLDDGKAAHSILAPAEILTKLTGITVEKAKDMATQALDQSVVNTEIAKKVIGRYFTFKCAPIDTNYLVKEIVEVN